MKLCVRATGQGCILAALLLLAVPLKWLAGAVFAAGFHELCHILAVVLTGGLIREIRIGAGGTELETEPMPPGKELCCALAGPMGSFLLFFLCRRSPVTAVCGLIQGLFNLLPIFPLDGGRALACLSALLLPGYQAERLCRWAEKMAVYGFVLAAVLGAFWLRLGIAPVLWVLLLLYRSAFRKKTLHWSRSQGTIDLPFIMR